MTNSPETLITPVVSFIVEYAIKGGGPLAVALTVIKLALPKIREWRAVLTELKQLVQTFPSLVEQGKQLTKVASELSTNGGATVKDAILRIEASNLRNEELLSRITAKQNRIWKNAGACLFYMDPNGFLTEANDALTDLVDKEEAQLLNTGWLNTIAIERRRQVLEEWEQAIRQHRIFEIETIMHVGQRNFPVLIRAVPLTVNNSTLIGYDGIVKPLERQ